MGEIIWVPTLSWTKGIKEIASREGEGCYVLQFPSLLRNDVAIRLALPRNTKELLIIFIIPQYFSTVPAKLVASCSWKVHKPLIIKLGEKCLVSNLDIERHYAILIKIYCKHSICFDVWTVMIKVQAVLITHLLNVKRERKHVTLFLYPDCLWWPSFWCKSPNEEEIKIHFGESLFWLKFQVCKPRIHFLWMLIKIQLHGCSWKESRVDKLWQCGLQFQMNISHPFRSIH